MDARYVDHMGSDLSIVNAARVSFDKESSWAEPDCPCQQGSLHCDGSCVMEPMKLRGADAKLIKYLAKHNHWTPFAHTSITLRMHAPVPIRTQCFKHKAGFVENEESRRYISSTPELFVPETLRSKPEGSIKQGSGDVHPFSETWIREYRYQCRAAMGLYEDMLSDGVCPEQARFVLPQGCQVNWYWTGNLAAFARFYNQRTDPHAQVEIQDLARMVGEIMSELYPVAWAALVTPNE